MIKNTKSAKHTLYEKNKRLARDWHPTKNSQLTPKNLTSYSNKKVWWMCQKSHEWEEIIADRYRGSVCLYCLFKKTPPVTSHHWGIGNNA